MKRDIKFRGQTMDGKWVYGLLQKSTGQPGQPPAGIYVSNSVGMPWAYQVRPETVGQFTSLLDKNGKEIYEGDIIGGGKTTAGTIIAWRVVFHFDGWKTGGGSHTPHRPNKGFWKRCEIIGNIHEHSELLAK